MDITAAFVAYDDTTKLGEPSVRARNDSAAALATSDAGNGVQRLDQHHAVVTVGAAQDDAEWRAMLVDDT